MVAPEYNFYFNVSVRRQPDVSSAIIRPGLLATTLAIVGNCVEPRIICYFCDIKILMIRISECASEAKWGKLSCVRMRVQIRDIYTSKKMEAGHLDCHAHRIWRPGH